MAAKRPLPPRPLPRWLVPAGSVLIGWHLLALAMLALSASSGPWPSPYGPSTAFGPIFATRIADVTTGYYLRPLNMTHNYHFPGNRPAVTQIVFEARLKDADGRLIETVRFPSPRDNAWLRQRHAQMANQLGEDEPVQPPGSEPIAAPGKKAPRQQVWEMTGPSRAALKEVETHLLPKGVPLSKPRPWTMIVARSYARYLLRKYQAASVELTRESRPAIVPALLFLEQPPAGTFDTLVSTFEEIRSEN